MCVWVLSRLSRRFNTQWHESFAIPPGMMSSRAGLSSQSPDRPDYPHSPSSSTSSFERFLQPYSRHSPYGAVRRHPYAKLLLVIVIAVEISAVVPTLWVEQQIGTRPEHTFLRILLMMLRLYPLLRTFVLCLYFSGPSRCFALLPFSLQWRCREWLLRSVSCRSHFPEIRWGLAVALDMWFLMTSPLIVGVRGDGSLVAAAIALLFANSVLCALDILALLMSFVYSKHFIAEVYPEVSFQRPQPIKWGIAEDGRDSACVICLSEFTEGEPAQLLPCGHVFHTDCVTSWLRVSHSCPMRCPDLVLPPAEPETQPSDEMGQPMPPELYVLPGEVRNESR